MQNFKDKIWLLGETPGSHHANKAEVYNLPGVNKMTPMEGLKYFGIPNLCRMKMGVDHGLSYLNDPYLIGEMDKCCLSIVGSGGWKSDKGNRDDLDEILEYGKRDPRLVAAIHDDFMFGDRANIFTPKVLRKQREILHTALDRPIELWSVFYDRDVNKDIQNHAREFDVTTFWTWYSENLSRLEENFNFAKKLTIDGRIILGIYMYDYGNARPMPDDLMKWQLDFAYEKFVTGEIEGMMLCSNCCADIGLSAVNVTKAWLDAMR